MCNDFKCVFIQWRAQGGVPVTSSKLYCMSSWQDLKEPIDYINSRTPDRPIFMFACSLGAICASLYLINEDGKGPVRAATFYGTPFNTLDNSPFFTTAAYGFYNWVLGKNIIKTLTPLFQDIFKYSSLQQIQSYKLLLENIVPCTLNNFDQYIISPMFGYQDMFDYRRQCQAGGKLNKLKIPCFYLHSWDDMLLSKDFIPTREI